MDEQEKLKQIEQMRTQLGAKATEELEAIWRKQDRDTRTDDALEIVREILLDRTGTFPDVDDDHMEIEELPDTYHKRSAVLSIAYYARLFSKLAIISIILSGIGIVLGSIEYISRGFSGNPSDAIYRLASAISILVSAGMAWTFLRALSEGLHILLDIEHNTRPASIAAKKNTG